MLKFLFSRKNKIPSFDDLNPKLLSPSLIWATIIGFSSLLTISSILLSVLLLWRIMNEDSTPSNGADLSSTTLLDKRKLEDAVKSMENRANSN